MFLILINLAILDQLLVPLPPLAELERIMARVAMLLTVLDRLHARLVLAKTGHDAFASAAVHHIDA